MNYFTHSFTLSLSLFPWIRSHFFSLEERVEWNQGREKSNGWQTLPPFISSLILPCLVWREEDKLKGERQKVCLPRIVGDPLEWIHIWSLSSFVLSLLPFSYLPSSILVRVRNQETFPILDQRWGEGIREGAKEKGELNVKRSEGRKEGSSNTYRGSKMRDGIDTEKKKKILNRKGKFPSENIWPMERRERIHFWRYFFFLFIYL